VPFVTPPNAPTEQYCRSILVPNSPQWVGIITGLLYDLIWASNWENAEDGMTPEAAAAVGYDIWAQYVASECGGGACDIPAPYWDDDDADDADDEDEPDTPEDWYGYIDETETWQERVEDWVIAAFIVAAGQPAAAIQFLTIAPKFRLAFRKRDYGAIVKIFLDAEEYATVDTYSATPDVAYIDVVAPSPSATLWVVHSGEHNPSAVPASDGEYKIEVIRKRLTPDEISNPAQRWNPDTNTVQYSPDGGVTWVDTPDADPRTSTVFLKPIPDPPAPSCDAAARVTAALRRMLDNYLASTDAAIFATGALNILLNLLGGYGVLVDFLIGLFGIFATIGRDEIEDAFTEDVWDEIKCIVQEYVGEDGYLSGVDAAAIQAEIAARIGGVVSATVDALFSGFGYVGLTNAITEGDETGDCEDCVPCGGIGCNNGNWDMSTVAGWILDAGVRTGTGAASYVGSRNSPINENAQCVQMRFLCPESGYAYNATLQFLAGGTGVTAQFELWRNGEQVWFQYGGYSAGTYSLGGDFGQVVCYDEVRLGLYGSVTTPNNVHRILNWKIE